MRPSIPPLRHSLDPAPSRVLASTVEELVERVRELDAIDRPLTADEHAEYQRLLGTIDRRCSSRLFGRREHAPVSSQLVRDVDPRA